MQTKIIKSIESAFCIDDEYARDLLKLLVKSLATDFGTGSTVLDSARFKCEQVYYKFYGVQPRKLEYAILPMIPLIASNKKTRGLLTEELSGIVDMSSDKVKHSDIQIAYRLAAFSYDSMLKNRKLELANLTEGMRNMLLDCSERLEGTPEIIAFEKSRIYAIQKIDRLQRKDREGISEKTPIDGLMQVLFQLFIEDREENDAELSSLKGLYAGALGMNGAFEGGSFIKSLCEYVYKLREGLIKKEGFGNVVCDPRSLVLLKEGGSSEDPILGRVCAKSVRLDGDVLSIRLDAKSGEYVFRFKRKQ